MLTQQEFLFLEYRKIFSRRFVSKEYSHKDYQKMTGKHVKVFFFLNIVFSSVQDVPVHNFCYFPV